MGDYSYVPKQLKIGDLKGNRFALGLRFVENYENAVIDESNFLQKDLTY
jgi:tRNA(Glu) U13 pseudouridine synthase TruD